MNTIQRVAVLDVVGLSKRHLQSSLPRLQRWANSHGAATIRPVLPAVTCTAQATYLTGLKPAQHGIVANGWYDRTLAEVHFWKQSNHLVQGPKVWETLRQQYPGFTCAKLFWWYNMYSSADFSITPRPMYPADGRKVFDIYSWPYSIRSEIKTELGEFPFPGFWGPAAGTSSPAGRPDCATRWIADSARWTELKYKPSLSLVYLPHLDYNLQRLGPDHSECSNDFAMVDQLVGDLIQFYESRGVRVLILSEYGITPVSKPVHLNRRLREMGLLTVKDELGLELLDSGNSDAFAVADHQVAHIYVANEARHEQVRRELEALDGVEQVLTSKDLERLGLRHQRSGDLLAIAKREAWFTYYYWLDDCNAPDFARCVDIHRKPGYDPVELFVDPTLRYPKLKIGWKLFQKKFGFRMLMDVVPLDATLVKGSHGICPWDSLDYPVLLGAGQLVEPGKHVEAEAIVEVIRSLVQPAA